MLGMIGNVGPWELILLIICIPIFIGSIALYFLPAVIAVIKKHPQMLYIILLNVLAGWTLFGWIAALIWVLITPKQEEEIK